jgi:hypothetical protein
VGHYATSRIFASSRPDEVNFLNVPNPSGRTSPWGSLSLQHKLLFFCLWY